MKSLFHVPSNGFKLLKEVYGKQGVGKMKNKPEPISSEEAIHTTTLSVDGTESVKVGRSGVHFLHMSLHAIEGHHDSSID